MPWDNGRFQHRAIALLRRGRRLAPVFSVAVFAAALLVLHHTLGRFDAGAVVATARAYPAATLLGALALSACSYLTLCGFDWMALHHLRRPLPLGWTSLVSFVSHAVSHNAGFALLTGGSVRLRMYSVFGLSVGEVAAVIAFAGLTFALGAAALGAAAFIAEGETVARLLHLPPQLVTGLGLALAAGLGCYLVWAGRARRQERQPRRFVLPSLALTLGQVAVAAFDLALVAAALYLLLPGGGGISYPAFVGIYVVATLAGTISHVPGGLGVFEGALTVMLPDLGAGPILGALLVFRVFYNLAPLLLAALVLAVFEIILRRRRRRDPPWLVSLGPPLAAALAFGAGVVLLISGAVEPPPALPIWLAEPAQLLSGAAGAVLLAAAWGLLRQIAAAYRLVVVVLASGAVAALVRGPDWVTAAFLAAAAAAIAAAQPLFQEEGAPTEAGLPWGWLGAAAAVVAAALWLTLERQPQGLQVAGHLLAFTADPSARALRAEVVAVAALAAAAAAGRWRGRMRPP